MLLRAKWGKYSANVMRSNTEYKFKLNESVSFVAIPRETRHMRPQN